MTKTGMHGVLRRLRSMASVELSDARGDAELLDRFARTADDMAFELLVWRHRRLVMSVCRRVLGDYHDAEDAFQATFLTLARKAASINKRECLAAWLYQVSYRIALSVRGQRRAQSTTDLSAIPSTHDPNRDTDLHELRSVLDEELNQLPASYRTAVVLCYLQGKTYREASAELGLPLGTISAHLSRARTLLRNSLARRGLVIPSATLASILCGLAEREGHSMTLVSRAVQTVLVRSRELNSAMNLSPTRAVALSDGVLRTMTIAKLKTGSIVCIAVSLLAVVVGAIAYHLAPATNRDPIDRASPPTVGLVTQTKEQMNSGGIKPPTVAEQFHNLVAARNADCQRWLAKITAAHTVEERNAVGPHDDSEYARKMWALATAAPNDPVILEILCHLAVFHCWSDVVPQALGRLHQDYVNDPRLGSMCAAFICSPDASAEDFLRAVKAKHPNSTVRAKAALALATHLRWCALQDHGRCRGTEKISLMPEEESQLVEEVESICKDTISRYSDEPWAPYYPDPEEAATTMGKKARSILDSLKAVDCRRLSIGQPAPEIIGVDSAGKSLKLINFRGQVVLLSFSIRSCGKPYRVLLPQKRELVKRLAGRPFALLAFDPSMPEEAADLQKFLTQEKVSWRVCPNLPAPRNSTDIWAWNTHHGPSLYLVDDRGVIRQRFDENTAETVLAEEVDRLVREAEERANPPKAK